MGHKRLVIGLIIMTALIFSSILWGHAATYSNISASSKKVSSVGYGVKNLTVKNPMTSCKISCASSVTKGSSITIRFSSAYNKSLSAKGKFLHDGWHDGIHVYKASSPSFVYSITNSKGSVVKSGTLSSSSSVKYSSSTTGKYTVKCHSVSTCSPDPKYAFVGIHVWTQTKMPSFGFIKYATSKTFTVKKPSTTTTSTTTNTSASTSTTKTTTTTTTKPKEVVHWVKPIVEHTTLWNSKRKAYNKKLDKADINSKTITLKNYKALKKPRPRYENVYWAGEKLLLTATTDKGATKIKASIVDTSFSTSLTKSDGIWSGTLWSKKMYSHWENTYPVSIKVKFTATFSDGKTAKDTVKLIIDQSAYDDILHRVI